MPSRIWTPDALGSEASPLQGRVWRLVEAQHQVSTLKLTDSLAEQGILENLIERSKPPVPHGYGDLHYLLATPFRYGAVYPNGSRFRRAGRTPGVFYASNTVEAAVAEMAFYRLLFFAESPDTPWPNDAKEFTAFAADFSAPRAICLAQPPFDVDHTDWTHPTAYEACQDLAERARTAGITAIQYASVRDPAGGTNVALLDPSVFTVTAPIVHQTWRIRLSSSGVQAIREFPSLRIEFDRNAFAADPRIAGFRWDR
jgi:hypothetical protein